MDVSLVFRAQFESDHKKHRGVEWRPHGHSYTIEITTVDQFDWSLGEDLAIVAAELHLKSLEDMLVGGDPSAVGLGVWFLERLQLGHPKITRAEVWEGFGVRAIVTRELRGPTK